MEDEYEERTRDDGRPLRVRRDDRGGRPSSNKSLWIILGAVGCVSLLGCLGLVALAGYWGFKAFTNDIPAAQTAADQFLSVLKEGKIEDAYASMSADYRAKHSPEQFAAFLKKIETFTRHTSRTRNGVRMHQDGSGKRVYIQMTLKAPNNATTCTLVMVEQDGTWKVDGITVP